jgi:hypothetical protein
MGERTRIRETVWQQRAGIGDRLERIANIAINFQAIDLTNPEHVSDLDARLNQNFFVGSAINRHGEGLAFAYGGTLPWWALIPRALWPDKPAIGGGGTIVADFTGIDLAEGTSFGAGQVLEFYVNFGWSGIFVGFFVVGFVLIRLDRGIMRALAAGDLRGLLLRALPGLMLLQPGGNLLEILVGAVAALIAAVLLLRVERRRVDAFLSVAIRTPPAARAIGRR